VASRADAGPAATESARSGFLPDRIIHLHPTRLCNLACLHCYSESRPGRRGGLDPGTVIRGLGVLADEGYEAVSLSGGEPLVYRDIGPVVRAAKELGFRVAMITNGLLVDGRNAPVVAGLDAMAISFDGLAATHDTIRARAGAFDRACAALERLAGEGRPVAAAISLTRDAIHELPDLAYHLAELGARALQIRPVARVGRAKEDGPERVRERRRPCAPVPGGGGAWPGARSRGPGQLRPGAGAGAVAGAPRLRRPARAAEGGAAHRAGQPARHHGRGRGSSRSGTTSTAASTSRRWAA
jgi:pyruvate-formate lyase-activating enzyme